MNNGRIFGNVTRNVRQTGCWSTADCRRSCSQAKFFDRSYRYAGPSLSNGLNGLSNFVYPSRDSFRLLPTPVSQLLFTISGWSNELFDVLFHFFEAQRNIFRLYFSTFRYFLFWFETNYYRRFAIFSRYSGIFSGYTSLLFAFLFCYLWLKRIVRCLFFEIRKNILDSVL